jgi:hypothetical protein
MNDEGDDTVSPQTQPNVRGGLARPFGPLGLHLPAFASINQRNIARIPLPDSPLRVPSRYHRHNLYLNDLWKFPPLPAQTNKYDSRRSGIFEPSKPPFEIQNMTFRKYFTAVCKHSRHTHSQSPSLSAAIHRRPDLYLDVLKAYYKHYDFTLWSTTDPGRRF